MVPIVKALTEKLFAWWQAAPQGALGGGILGLCLLLLGWWQLRGPGNRPAPGQAPRQLQGSSRQQQQQAPAADGSTSRAVVRPTATDAATAKPAQQQHHASTPAARAVSSMLAGVRRITISAPGVLLEEWEPAELQDSATARPEACEIVKEMCRVGEVTVLAHVSDDVGQAAVTGALEAAGLVGTSQGQLKPHRLLFCSTNEGKVSMVRQLDPELHIDGSRATVDSLQRFIPQLLLVAKPAGQACGVLAANIGQIASLKSHFGL